MKKNKLNNEITISINEAYVKGGLISFIVIVPFIIVFYLINDLRINYLISFLDNISNIDIISLIIFGTIIHELLHGFSWYIFGKTSIKDIKCGFNLKSFTPYCHCKKALSKKSYVIGTLMPFFVLGLTPLTLSIILNRIDLLLFGITFTFAASGDLYCYWKIKNYSSNKLYLDHPTKIGVIIK